MKHVKLTAAERKAATLLAFESAMASPDAADWRALAVALAGLVPKGRAGAAAVSEWGEYAIKRTDSSVRQMLLLATFADGREHAISFRTIPGKPFNCGSALRAVCDFYRNRVITHVERAGGTAFAVGRTDRIAVPEFLSVSVRDYADESAEALALAVESINATTMEKRAGDFVIADHAALEPKALWEAFKRATGSRASYEPSGVQCSYDAIEAAREHTWRTMTAEASTRFGMVPGAPGEREHEFIRADYQARCARLLQALQAFLPSMFRGGSLPEPERRNPDAPSPIPVAESPSARVIPFSRFAARMMGGTARLAVAA